MPPEVTEVRKKVLTKPATNGQPKAESVIDRLHVPVFDDTIKCLIYGAPSTGKSRLASTFPTPICWVVCSLDDESDRNPEELRSVSRKILPHIRTVSLRDPDELKVLIRHAKGGMFNTFVLDHTAGLEDLSVKKYKGTDEIPAQRSWGDQQQSEWLEIAKIFKDNFRPIMGLSCNVVVIAQEKVREPKDGQQVTKMKGTVGNIPSIGDWLEMGFTNMFRTYTCPLVIDEEYLQQVPGKKPKKAYRKKTVPNKRDYRLQMNKDDLWVIKCRTPEDAAIELPQSISNPTYAKILDLINGGDGGLLGGGDDGGDGGVSADDLDDKD